MPRLSLAALGDLSGSDFFRFRAVRCLTGIGEGIFSPIGLRMLAIESGLARSKSEGGTDESEVQMSELVDGPATDGGCRWLEL